ncbi:MAG: hypothetical protein HC842_06900 [Cytophagales bacterium]|nr:hypothetical protein [Cytophagales bacterium]
MLCILLASFLLLSYGHSQPRFELSTVEKMAGYDIYFLADPASAYSAHFDFNVSDLIGKEGNNFRERLEICLHKVINEAQKRGVEVDALVFDERGYGEAISYDDQTAERRAIPKTLHGINVYALSQPLDKVASSDFCFPKQEVDINALVFSKNLKKAVKFAAKHKIPVEAIQISPSGEATFIHYVKEYRETLSIN